MLYHRPAVYKCIIPVKKPLSGSSAIYNSPIYKSGDAPQEPPFPAWPEIDDPSQPCCLPTLMRAVYFEHVDPLAKSNEVAIRIGEYLSRQEAIETCLSEQVLAIAKSRQMFFVQHSAELGTLPRKTFTSDNALMNYLKNSDDINMQVIKASMQASIYGNFENFYGVEDAFAYAHECAHRSARMLHCGVVLDKLSEDAHTNLVMLAKKSFSPEQIVKEWAEFWQRNNQIKSLVQRFEPIEEIYATYVGLLYLPTEVRNEVETSVEVELSERNWHKAYSTFVEICNIFSEVDQLQSALNITVHDKIT